MQINYTHVPINLGTCHRIPQLSRLPLSIYLTSNHEPTRGIDVGAHAEIIRLIETLCADGLALLVISSELEELVGYADRVIIMRDRQQVAELALSELSVPAIMNAIAA